MAYYYVKTGGTAGDTNQGRYASLNTGSFANALSNDWGTQGLGAATDYYYATVNEIFNGGYVTMTAVAATDVIVVSSSHAETYAGNLAFTFPSTTVPTQLVCVDDANADTESTGASLNTSGGGTDLSFTAMSNWKGFTLTQIDDFRLFAESHMFEHCTITIGGSGDRMSLTNEDGVSVVFIDTTINFTNATAAVAIGQGGKFEWYGGTLGVSGNDVNDFFTSGSWAAGGGSAFVQGVDLSNLAVAAGTGYFVGGGGGDSTNDDNAYIRLEGCRVASSGFSFCEEEFADTGFYFLATNCGATSAEAEYQFFQRTWGGDVEDQDDTGIHRDESTAFPSGTKVSLKCIANSSCTPEKPLVFDLPSRYCELSAGTTDTIAIYFASTTTLTDQNVWAEVLYQDGTNNHVYNRLSNRAANRFASANNHTDDSGSSTWKDGASDLAAYNEYVMKLDTSGDVGADCVPIIRIYVGVNATIYFDTTVDLVAS